MRYSNQLFPFLVMFMLLVGCNNDNEQYTLIASEKSLPSNFYEMAFQRKEVPFFQYGVTKADNQTQYEESWDLYKLEKKWPSINLNEKSVFFIGLTDSDSCSIELNDIKVNSENKTMTILLNDSGGSCTADASPRTFVIEIDKEISRDIKNVIIVEDKVETDIPFDY